MGNPLANVETASQGMVEGLTRGAHFCPSPYGLPGIKLRSDPLLCLCQEGAKMFAIGQIAKLPTNEVPMKFIMPVLIAFSLATSSYAEPGPVRSEKVLTIQDEAGRTTVVVGNMKSWLAVVGPYISRSARLPKELRENGPWGDFVVKIKFTVTPEGEVSDAQIDESSGDSQVDAYALEAVKAVKLFPFTRDMGGEDLVFALPINIKNDRPAAPAEAE